MTIRFDGQVAIITGAGNGLGKCHALELAKRGAKVVINDFGGARDGSGGSLTPAESVVEEIEAGGGKAIANGANVADADQCGEMVEQALSTWGRVDVLINNAGNLRDKSFGKMSPEDWSSVIDVHLNGSANCSLAVWNQMKEQRYGRILMTTSTSGIYGNFGQANYGAAKFGLVGLMNTLCIEGKKNNIHINCLSPTAATRMTDDILPPDMLGTLNPEFATPAAVFLVSEEAPSRQIILAGAGTYATLEVTESKGVYLPQEKRTAEDVSANFEAISNMEDADVFTSGTEHVMKIIQRASENSQG